MKHSSDRSISPLGQSDRPMSVDSCLALIRRRSFSLVSWAELPPITILQRGDLIRLSHGLSALTQQVTSVIAALNTLRVISGLGSTDLIDRVQAVLSLEDPALSCYLASEMVKNALTELGKQNQVAVAPLLSVSPNSAAIPLGVAKARCRAVSAAYRRLGGHSAALTNSWARGVADGGSDLDVRFFADHTTPRAQRLEIAEGLCGEVVRQYDEGADLDADQFALDGIKIDVQFHLMGAVDRHINSPGAASDHPRLLEAVQTSLAVDDPQKTFVSRQAALQRVACDRGREVAVAALKGLEVSMAMPLPSNEIEAEWLIRGEILERLTRAIVAHNAKFHAYPKWLHKIVPDLNRQPENTLERLGAVAGTGGESTKLRWHEARSLMDDISRMVRVAK